MALTIITSTLSKELMQAIKMETSEARRLISLYTIGLIYPKVLPAQLVSAHVVPPNLLPKMALGCFLENRCYLA